MTHCPRSLRNLKPAPHLWLMMRLQVAILDEAIDTVVREAERSAEVEGLTVGMLGGGVACYALAGWWADMALPGGCKLVAGPEYAAVPPAAPYCYHDRPYCQPRRLRTAFAWQARPGRT